MEVKAAEAKPRRLERGGNEREDGLPIHPPLVVARVGRDLRELRLERRRVRVGEGQHSQADGCRSTEPLREARDGVAAFGKLLIATSGGLIVHSPDGMLVILTPQDMTEPTAIAEHLKPYTRMEVGGVRKPVLASWMGGSSVVNGERILNQAGIPTFAYPDTAARAFEYMWRYTYNLRALYETPTLADDPAAAPDYRSKAAAILDAARAEDLRGDLDARGVGAGRATDVERAAESQAVTAIERRGRIHDEDVHVLRERSRVAECKALARHTGLDQIGSASDAIAHDRSAAEQHRLVDHEPPRFAVVRRKDEHIGGRVGPADLGLVQEASEGDRQRIARAERLEGAALLAVADHEPVRAQYARPRYRRGNACHTGQACSA